MKKSEYANNQDLNSFFKLLFTSIELATPSFLREFDCVIPMNEV